jgi:WD40 repeat protein
LKIWDLDKVAKAKADKKQPEPEKAMDSHLYGFGGFAMAPDGKHFVTAGRDNVLKVWETATGKEVRTLDFHVPPLSFKSFLRNLAAAPDSKHVVTANANTTLFLVELP